MKSKPQVLNQVSMSERGRQVRSQVNSQINNQISNQVSNQVSNQISNQVWNQVHSGNQVYQVRNRVRSEIDEV